MKKQLQKVLALLMVLLMVSALGGCKDKQDEGTETPTGAGTETSGSVSEPETMAPMVQIDDISEYVVLGEYMNLEAVRGDDTITDEEIQEAIDYACEANAAPEKLTEGTVADGDTVGIYYVGTLDGVAFEGGTGEYELTIGSNTFIDGFESGLIGVKVGETVDLNLTFPENYGNTDLAGKAVIFTVTVNYLCGENVVPEFDDALAVELGYADEEEMRADMLKNMQEAKTESVEEAFRAAVWQKAVENAEILKVNEEIYDYYYQTLISQYQSTVQMYGMTLEDYLELTGMTQEEFEKQADEYATQCMEQELVCRAIVKAEGLSVSEEDYQAALADFYSQYSTSFADAAALEAYYSRERLENDILWTEIIDRVMESGIPVEASEAEPTTAAQ
ncbi:MAG: trigger factor [Lachnospiraceae bacterium]|nr:trigger factor [Lachnospiraceae bacterium]